MTFWILLLVLAVGIGIRLFLFQKPASASGQAINLRCTLCGNYFPSREHFATDQVCKSCHERVAARS